MSFEENYIVKNTFNQSVFGFQSHPVHGADFPILEKLGTLAEVQALHNQMCCLIMARTLFEMNAKGHLVEWANVSYGQQENVSFTDLFDSARSCGLDQLSRQVALNLGMSRFPTKYYVLPGMQNAVGGLEIMFYVAYSKSKPFVTPSNGNLVSMLRRTKESLILMKKVGFSIPNEEKFDEYVKSLARSTGLVRLGSVD